MRRRTGLTALFWRYLLVTGGAVVLLAVNLLEKKQKAGGRP